MIHDDSPDNEIMKTRSEFSKELRWFSLLSTTLNKSQYYEMVDWQNTPVTDLLL